MWYAEFERAQVLVAEAATAECRPDSEATASASTAGAAAVAPGQQRARRAPASQSAAAAVEPVGVGRQHVERRYLVGVAGDARREASAGQRAISTTKRQDDRAARGGEPGSGVGRQQRQRRETAAGCRTAAWNWRALKKAKTTTHQSSRKRRGLERGHRALAPGARPVPAAAQRPGQGAEQQDRHEVPGRLVAAVHRGQEALEVLVDEEEARELRIGERDGDEPGRGDQQEQRQAAREFEAGARATSRASAASRAPACRRSAPGATMPLESTASASPAQASSIQRRAARARVLLGQQEAAHGELRGRRPAPCRGC